MVGRVDDFTTLSPPDQASEVDDPASWVLVDVFGDVIADQVGEDDVVVGRLIARS